ncbi:glutathione S-transferase [Sporobolomyces koalae]|uniref:glutathione S-transferase n=1 Tax=Sporobolomyces koalae TaxID=500713 RepID=UPI003177A8B4
MSAAEYELVYHEGIPGRGEFVRLLFEATATPYTDTALSQGQGAIEPYMNGTFDGNEINPIPFAPPVLRHGQNVISQTPNILLYLSTRLRNPIDLASSEDATARASGDYSPPTCDDVALFHVHAMTLTILDLNNETHDTHHPISVSSYYEDQKSQAIERARDFRKNRVPKFFRHFEQVLEKGGQGWLIGTNATYADLCLFQVIDGLKFAFPNLLSKLLPSHPKLESHYARVKAAPRIKQYLESDRRQQYSMGVFRHYQELDEPNN